MYSEKVKFLLTALLSWFVFFSSQAEKRDDELRKLMWESGDPAFAVTEVPDKWKNESAVILAQRKYCEYEKEVYLKYLYEKEYFHKRVKLQDKASVTEYSEVSFPMESGYERYYVGVKIIKPSGSEIVVDLKDAVVMEKEINQYKTVKYKKAAIPSLEPGDILDYYICMEKTISLILLFHSFPEVLYSMQESHPILDQTLEFKLKRRCFLNIKSINGAPELKIKDDPKDESTIYYVNLKDQDKISDKLWFYEYRSVPTIKFQVFYTNAGSEGIAYLGSPRVPKTSFTQEEILRYVKSVIPSDYKNYELDSYLLKYQRNEKDPQKLLNAAFDYYRFTRYYYSNEAFVTCLSRILKKRKVPHELIICVPSPISSIDKAIFPGELYYILKVNTATPFYVCPFGVHSLYNDIEPMVQGTDAYAMDMMVPKSKQKLQPVKIPVMKHTDNSTSHKAYVSLDEDDFKKLKIKMEVTLKGENKNSRQESLILYEDYMDEESKRLNQKTFVENLKGKKTKYREEEIAKFERMKEEDEKEREKKLKTIAEEEYDAKVISVRNFTLKETGRWSERPDMIYSEEIEFEGLVKRAGENYIFEVGKLIGKQIEVSEEEKKRTYDIYMAYARSFSEEITIEIPEGYTVEGVENLNMESKNETGGFVSKATVSDNKLIITTNKYYAHNYEKAEDWNKIIEFLETAYNFTQQKVLLKRK